MRVRFEIRQLPPGQWDKVVRALWIMKMTSMDEGKARYGSSFVSYDWMVANGGDWGGVMLSSDGGESWTHTYAVRLAMRLG